MGMQKGKRFNRKLRDVRVWEWDLNKRRKDFRESSCPPAGPRNPCKTSSSPLHDHPFVLFARGILWDLIFHLKVRESMFFPIWQRRNQSPVLVHFDRSCHFFFGHFHHKSTSHPDLMLWHCPSQRLHPGHLHGVWCQLSFSQQNYCSCCHLGDEGEYSKIVADLEAWHKHCDQTIHLQHVNKIRRSLKEIRSDSGQWFLTWEPLI